MDPGRSHEFNTHFSASTHGDYYRQHVAPIRWALILTALSSFRVDSPAFPACRVLDG